MSPDNPDRMDGVELLIKIAIFVCFIAFGVCMWFIKRERDKQKASNGKNGTPPKISDG